jgi:hypothetical protein
MSSDKNKKILDDTLAQFVGKEASPESVQELGKVLIPIIRNFMPSLLAADIIGTQPMSIDLPSKMAPKYREPAQYNEQVPKGYLVIDANREVSQWIEEQPIYHWKHGQLEQMSSGLWDRYIISEKLYTWLKLRWQA